MKNTKVEAVIPNQNEFYWTLRQVAQHARRESENRPIEDGNEGQVK